MARRISSGTLIGRGPELIELADGLARATAGLPSVYMVVGPAGIGKTRLVAELEHRAAEEGALVLHGTCVAFAGSELPYAPVLGALQDVPHDLLTSTVAALPRMVRGELERLVPFANVEDARPRDGVASPGADARMREHLHALLRCLAEAAPVLLVIEDVHWADQSTRDFLAFLARNLRDDRIVAVLTHRPEDVPVDGAAGISDADRARGGSTRAFLGALRLCATVQAVELETFGREEVHAQARAILGSEPSEEMLERLLARAQGNPFYVEELLAIGPDSRGGLPSALQTALLIRVEALPSETQRLLRTMSAFGRPVEQGVIGSAAAMEEPDLSDRLREAIASHLVVEEEGGALAFRHALTREAVYGTLLPGERRLVHRAVAVALGPARADPGELARHWRQAGEAGEALVASIAAGRAAMDVYAFVEAFDHFRACLDLWTDSAPLPEARLDRVDVIAAAAEAAACAGDSSAAIALCREGLDRLDPTAAPARAAWFHERLGRYQVWDLDASLASYREALHLLPEAASPQRARLLADEALALMLMVRWQDARERCQEALADARALGARAEEAYARAILGLVLAYLGDVAGCDEHLDTARRLAERHGRPEDVARVYVHHGEAMRLRGRVDGALALMREGERVARRLGVEASYGRFISISAVGDLFEIGDWEGCAEQLGSLSGAELVRSEELLLDAAAGRLAAGRGELGEARARLARALAKLDDAVPCELTSYVAAVACEVAIISGDAAGAGRQAHDTLERIGERQDRLYTAWLIAAATSAEAELAEEARARREPESANAAVTRAERLLEALRRRLARGGEGPSPPASLAHLAVAEAEVERARGVHDAGAWRRAVDAWDALDQPYPAAWARLRLGEALLITGAGRPDANVALAAAKATADELGAGPLCAAIGSLARRGRLDLSAQADPTYEEVGADVASWEEQGLTAREAEVLALLAEGLTNREIAGRLFISPKTVSVHVSRILTKLDAPNRVYAATVAQRLGLVPAGVQEPSA